MTIPSKNCGSPGEVYKGFLIYLPPSKVKPVMPLGTTAGTVPHRYLISTSQAIFRQVFGSAAYREDSFEDRSKSQRPQQGAQPQLMR